MIRMSRAFPKESSRADLFFAVKTIAPDIARVHAWRPIPDQAPATTVSVALKIKGFLFILRNEKNESTDRCL